MKKERIEYLAYLVVALAGAVALGYIFLRYVFFAVLPFLLAWLAAFAARGPANRLSRKTKIPMRVWRLIIAAVVTIGVIVTSVALVRLILGELWNLLSGLGENNRIGEFVGTVSDRLLGLLGSLELPPEIEKSITDALSGAVSSLLSGIGGVISGVAAAIPRILLFIVITLIAAVYFAIDLEGINAAVKRILPSALFDLLVRVKNGALSITVKYLRSYFLIMLITFSEMLIGLLLLGVRYALLFAILIALLDLLPVIGVGTALLPASILSFVSGDRRLAIGLLILFVASSVIRQLAEPKILGKHLGVHPLATLAAMYIGYAFFGFAGVLILPLLVVVLGIYKDNSSEVA